MGWRKGRKRILKEKALASPWREEPLWVRATVAGIIARAARAGRVLFQSAPDWLRLCNSIVLLSIKISVKNEVTLFRQKADFCGGSHPPSKHAPSARLSFCITLEHLMAQPGHMRGGRFIKQNKDIITPSFGANRQRAWGA